MKKVILFLCIFLNNQQIYSWATFAALYRHPETHHAVGLLGDYHLEKLETVEQQKKTWEANFTKIVNPYVAIILNSKPSFCNLLLEGNLLLLYQTYLASQNKSIYTISLLNLLNVFCYNTQEIVNISKIFSLSQKFVNFYQSFIKELKKAFQINNDYNLIIPADYRTGAIFQLLYAHREGIFLAAYRSLLPFQHHIKRTIKGSGREFEQKINLEIIDMVFFNKQNPDINISELSDQDILLIKNQFVYNLRQILQEIIPGNTLFKLQDIANQVQPMVTDINKIVGLSISSEYAEILQKIGSKILYINSSAFPQLWNNLSNPLDDSLIELAHKIQSFYYLTFHAKDFITEQGKIYFDEKTFQILNAYAWIMDILSIEYADAGFLFKILSDSNMVKHDLLFAGQLHTRHIAKYLKKLGYQEIMIYSSDNNELLNADKLRDFFENFIFYSQTFQ